MSYDKVCAILMRSGYGSSLLNVGTDVNFTIRELAEMVKGVVELWGELLFAPLNQKERQEGLSM